jgi:hypothetical protein
MNTDNGAPTNPIVSIAEAPPCPPAGGHAGGHDAAVGFVQQGDVSHIERRVAMLDVVQTFCCERPSSSSSSSSSE